MTRITDPNDPALDSLCELLAERSPQWDTPNAWPAESLALCGESGVFEWFLGVEHGGQGWTDGDVMRGYLKLSAACLTTTFVLTQRTGACRRIASGDSDFAREQYLADLLTSKRFATVGVSHLTTSRRHLRKPVLSAEETGDGFVLQGQSPWVTGGEHADLLVLGATLPDGREILAAVPTETPGISAPPSAELVGLSASCTGAVHCDEVLVPREWVLGGPVEKVMQQGKGAGTGGLQTSVLAVGHAAGSLQFICAEAERRPDLLPAHEALESEWTALRDLMLAAADGLEDCDPGAIRAGSNSLALRASQAALSAAKGAGYVWGHPAGRWCREALFFLVWSCPQSVVNANLCELAGLSNE